MLFKNLEILCEKHSKCLTKNERKVILNKGWEISKFYVLPKINKCKQIADQIQRPNSEYIQMEMPETLKSRLINGGLRSVSYPRCEQIT